MDLSNISLEKISILFWGIVGLIMAILDLTINISPGLPKQPRGINNY